MDSSSVFEVFLADLKSKYPDLSYTYDLDTTAKDVEAFYPSAIQILQKDGAFFDVERRMFGINLSELTVDDDLWKHIQFSAVASFFHGDIKSKFGTILNTAKSMWSGSGHENDEISRVLNDDSAESNLESLYTYIMETRIVKIVMEILEQIDLTKMDVGTIDSPEQLLEMIRNPEHPVLKKFIAKVKGLLEEKMKRGSITQQQMMEEVEGIKAKIQSIFGNVLGEALGVAGRRADVPAAVLTSNSPEARRQRMIARLQRKRNEKSG
jgi:hypothetical protein